MDDQARTDEDRVLSVRLDLHLDRQPISGRLRTEWGADERFVGWLGFVGALKRLHELRETSADPAGDQHALRDGQPQKVHPDRKEPR